MPYFGYVFVNIQTYIYTGRTGIWPTKHDHLINASYILRKSFQITNTVVYDESFLPVSYITSGLHI